VFNSGRQPLDWVSGLGGGFCRVSGQVADCFLYLYFSTSEARFDKAGSSASTASPAHKTNRAARQGQVNAVVTVVSTGLAPTTTTSTSISAVMAVRFETTYLSYCCLVSSCCNGGPQSCSNKQQLHSIQATKSLPRNLVPGSTAALLPSYRNLWCLFLDINRDYPQKLNPLPVLSQGQQW
jgi:hypothetical protein